MLQRHAVFLARLLHRAQPFQFGLQADDFLADAVEKRHLKVERLLPSGQGYRQLAGFALHGQWAGARFLSARHGVAVVTDAVRHQEIQVRIGRREPLRRGAVFRQEAQRKPRQQVHRAIAEPVGETQRFAQPRGDPCLRPYGRLGQMRVGMPVRLGVHQERGAAVELRADEIHPALGLLPVLHHHVFQLFVQEFLGRLFELRVHFHVIRQHAQRLQVRGLAFFERREQTLHRFGGIGAVRQYLLERFLAGADLRHFILQSIDRAPQFHRGVTPLAQILLGTPALTGDGFQFQLALYRRFRKLLARDFQAIDFRG